MRAVLPYLALARSVAVANVWLLDTGTEGRFLVDTGFVLERPALLGALRRAGLDAPGTITAILLTHRHADHAGNAAWLRERLRCPLLCHRADAAVLTGERPPPRLSGRGAMPWHEVLCRIEDRWPPRTPVDEPFDEGPLGWGFHAFLVGGHTEGSTLLWHEPTGVLFTGDVVLTGAPVVLRRERLGLAVADYCLDVDLAHRATRTAVERMPPVSAIASGHGPPVIVDADRKLRALAVAR